MPKMLKKIGRRLKPIRKRFFDPRSHVLKLISEGWVCAEIGVWKGQFSKKILRRNPAKVHLIDPWLYLPEFGNRVYGKRGDNSQEKIDEVYCEVVEIFGNNPKVVIHHMTSEEAVRIFPDDYFDFIYIDGNHNYEFVKKDIEMYLPKVKNGGYITGDDYEFPRCKRGGPKRAVKEALNHENVELLTIKNNQFVLRKL